MTRRSSIGAAAVLVVMALVILLRQGPDTQTVKVPLETAGGLRPGSQVKVGGVPVGEIADIALNDEDVPVAELEVDPEKARIGRDTRVEVVTSNLLGSKFISLEPGRRESTDTVALAASSVTYPTDIDQVLATLDADTRTRLQVLLNELGYAVTGRRADFREAMRLLPRDLDVGAQLLSELGADNETLGRLVEEAGRSVKVYAREREQLVRFVDVFDGTLQTTAAKREQLAATLDEAPSTLREAQGFLADLERTAAPLGPAARTLAATAPELDATLAEVPAFEQAARPALAEATDVAPLLTRLAVRATPTIRRAAPVLRRLATFAEHLEPVGTVLRASVDDTLGTLEGWARAIQTSDGFSHVFRGRATLGPEFFRSLLGTQGGVQLVPDAPARKRGRRRAPGRAPAAPVPTAAPRAPQRPDRLQPLLEQVLGNVKRPLDPLLEQPLGNAGSLLDGAGKQSQPLLDYLLRP